MKKISILLCAATAIAALSCNKEVQDVQEPLTPQTPEVELVPMTFTATTTETRTVLDEDHVSIKWLSTDKISVWDGHNNREFTSNGEGTKVKFNGEAADAQDYLALYPYDANAVFGGISAHTTLAADQEPVNGSFANGLNINAATSADKTTFFFENVMSVAKFTLDATKLGGKTIKSVKFASTYPLAGDVNVLFSNEGISASAGDATVKEVTMTSESGLADGTYYFVVLPNAGGEISMTFESTDGFIARKTATLSNPFTAGYIKNLGTVQGLVWTKVFFYESFDKCTGTGGNDGSWSGNIATNAITTDNEGWTIGNNNNWGGSHCIRLGTTKIKGEAVTPTLGFEIAQAFISFASAAWAEESSLIQLHFEEGTGSEVQSLSPTALSNHGFGEHTATLNNVTEDSKLVFSASDYRFWLDEVLIYVGDKTLAFELARCSAPDEPETVNAPVITPESGTYTTSQTVTISAEGADKVFYGINEEPTTEYTAPFTVSSSCTVKAYAVKGDIASEVTEAVYTIVLPGSVDIKYDFSEISFTGWSSSYAEHVVEYPAATVTFASASKQSSTITNIPVTKGGDVELVLKQGTMTKVKFVCQQWATKKQTITLHYSTDGGDNYTSTSVTSTNFQIEKSDLPSGTNAVKITFSSNSNQVGISYVEFTMVN